MKANIFRIHFVNRSSHIWFYILTVKHIHTHTPTRKNIGEKKSNTTTKRKNKEKEVLVIFPCKLLGFWSYLLGYDQSYKAYVISIQPIHSEEGDMIYLTEARKGWTLSAIALALCTTYVQQHPTPALFKFVNSAGRRFCSVSGL